MVRADEVTARRQAIRWHGRPLPRFILLGTLLWLGDAYLEWRASFSVEAPSEQSLEILYQDWAQRAGAYPDDRQREQIARIELEDRVLFKEAVRQRLYLDDPLVHQRLLINARFVGLEGDDAEMVRMATSLKLHLGDALIRRHLIEKLKTNIRARAHPVPTPSRDLLDARYLAEKERWARAPSIELEHIFISADRSDLSARTKQIKDALNAGLPSGDASYRLGDRFLLGNRLPSMELPRLKDSLGAAFAVSIQNALESGEAVPGSPAWFGPITSSYGAHFVRVMSYRGSGYRTLDEVESTLIYEYERGAERDALIRYVRELLMKYDMSAA